MRQLLKSASPRRLAWILEQPIVTWTTEERQHIGRCRFASRHDHDLYPEAWQEVLSVSPSFGVNTCAWCGAELDGHADRRVRSFNAR